MLDSSQTTFRTNRRYAVHADEWTPRQTCIFAPYIEPDHAVLEYRCGDGGLLETLNGGITAGIEPDSIRAGAARKKGLDVRASVHDFDKAKTFDRIVISHSIDELGTALQDLTALRPLLHDEGLLLLGHAIESRGPVGLPSQHQRTLIHLKKILSAAGYVTESVSVMRNSYRSAGFQFRARENDPPDARKTYWMVKPFLSLLAVARKDVSR